MPLIQSNNPKFNILLQKIEEIGYIERITHPIVYVSGLPGAVLNEIVLFETGEEGYIFSLEDDYAKAVTFSVNPLELGTKVARTGKILGIKINDKVLGNVLDPLGRSMLKNVKVSREGEDKSIDIAPMGVDKRERVHDPLITGVPLVDFLIPLGKGQRELIIGDRNTGKTAFVMQTMLSQANKNSICIYTAIGKKQESIKEVEEYLKKRNIFDKCVIVGASSADSLGKIFVAPYTAMTIAEYFRDKGKNVLVILDDLTTHARYFRELSLISGKFPGKDSYPGDVFYVHARLLERAGNFKHNDGRDVSISCLPIAETIEGDLSGYIQTNLMSITDGHIFFDQEMYKEGKRPAINYFLSVTRVGRQTQNNVRWGVNRELSSFFYLHRKTKKFIHFGAELNEGIRSTLEMGEKLDTFFDQPMEEVIDINIQIMLFTLIWSGILKNESEGKIRYYLSASQNLYQSDPGFKNKVNKLINSCNDFNQLLGKVSAQHKEIIERLERGYEKN